MDKSQDLVRANIKRLRNLHGMTQAELAEACELSTNFIAELESGRKQPSLDTLDSVCRVLGVRPFELFIGDGDGQVLGESEPEYAFKERLKRDLLRWLEAFR